MLRRNLLLVWCGCLCWLGLSLPVWAENPALSTYGRSVPAVLLLQAPGPSAPMRQDMRQDIRQDLEQLLSRPELSTLLSRHLQAPLSLAYLPAEQQSPTWLFNAGVSAPVALARELSALAATAGRKETYAGKILYHFAVPLRIGHTAGHAAAQLSLCLSQNRLLGSLGPSETALKDMLYTQALPAQSAWKLANQSSFQSALQNSKQKTSQDTAPVWLYLDSHTVLQALFRQPELQDFHFEKQYWLQDMAYYLRYLGLSVSFRSGHWQLKGTALHDGDKMSLFQQSYLNRLFQHELLSLQALLAKAPARPALLGMDQVLDLDLVSPWPSSHPQPFVVDLPEMRANLKFLQTRFHLQVQRDLLPYLDGRALWAVRPQSQSEEGACAVSGADPGNMQGHFLILGIRPLQQAALERTLLNRLSYQVGDRRFRPQAQGRESGEQIYLLVPELGAKNPVADCSGPAYAIQDKLLLVAPSVPDLKRLLAQKQNPQPQALWADLSTSEQNPALQRFFWADLTRLRPLLASKAAAESELWTDLLKRLQAFDAVALKSRENGFRLDFQVDLQLRRTQNSEQKSGLVLPFGLQSLQDWARL